MAYKHPNEECSGKRRAVLTPKIIVVLPTLNEEEAIGSVIDDLKRYLKSYNHEILIVDGHSTDNTVKIAKNHGAHVIYQRQKGYGEALYTGFIYAREKMGGDILVTMDGDGTYDPKDVPNLLQPILNNTLDLAVGKRMPEVGAMKKTNILGNRLISWLVKKLLHINVSDTQSGMFAFRSYLIDFIELKVSGWAFNTEILSEAKHVGMRIGEVPITYRKRLGKSKLNIFQAGLINLGVILRLARDFEPLLLFGAVAILLIALGVFLGLIILVEFIMKGTMRHLALSIFSSLCITTGIQLFSLGLIADMIKDLKNRSKYGKSPKKNTNNLGNSRRP